MQGDMVVCAGFHAKLSPKACRANRQLAMGAAIGIVSGVPFCHIGLVDITRMFVCGKCDRLQADLLEAEVDIDLACYRVKADIRAMWEEIERKEARMEKSGWKDPEVARANKRATAARWRANHPELARARQKVCRDRNREKKRGAANVGNNIE